MKNDTLKNLKLILAVVGSLIISGAFLGFALWAALAKAEFQIALQKVGTAAIHDKQTVSVSPAPISAKSSSSYILRKGQLVEVDIRQLALEAWDRDKLLPGKDGKYNWVEIGLRIADWKEAFRKYGDAINDEAFDAAYSAIARQNEEHLRERAFERSQE